MSVIKANKYTYDQIKTRVAEYTARYVLTILMEAVPYGNVGRRC
jgi:hypothetical protein